MPTKNGSLTTLHRLYHIQLATELSPPRPAVILGTLTKGHPFRLPAAVEISYCSSAHHRLLLLILLRVLVLLDCMFYVRFVLLVEVFTFACISRPIFPLPELSAPDTLCPLVPGEGRSGRPFQGPLLFVRVIVSSVSTQQHTPAAAAAAAAAAAVEQLLGSEQ